MLDLGQVPFVLFLHLVVDKWLYVSCIYDCHFIVEQGSH